MGGKIDQAKDTLKTVKDSLEIGLQRAQVIQFNLQRRRDYKATVYKLGGGQPGKTYLKVLAELKDDLYVLLGEQVISDTNEQEESKGRDSDDIQEIESINGQKKDSGPKV